MIVAVVAVRCLRYYYSSSLAARPKQLQGERSQDCSLEIRNTEFQQENLVEALSRLYYGGEGVEERERESPKRQVEDHKSVMKRRRMSARIAKTRRERARERESMV